MNMGFASMLRECWKAALLWRKHLTFWHTIEFPVLWYTQTSVFIFKNAAQGLKSVQSERPSFTPIQYTK